MGAATFSDHAAIHKGETIEAAFDRLVRGALHDYGHRNYTGTIAEKQSFVFIAEVDSLDAANALTRELIRKDDSRIRDKWGPAGCVTIKPLGASRATEAIFFGWASE